MPCTTEGDTMDNVKERSDFTKELIAVRRKLAKAMLYYEAFMEREGLEAKIENTVIHVCRCRELIAKKR